MCNVHKQKVKKQSLQFIADQRNPLLFLSILLKHFLVYQPQLPRGLFDQHLYESAVESVEQDLLDLYNPKLSLISL